MLRLLISIVFNANTFQIAQRLSVDPEARREIIEQAYAFIGREEARSSRDAQVEVAVDSLERRVRQLIDEELRMTATALGIGGPSSARCPRQWGPVDVRRSALPGLGGDGVCHYTRGHVLVRPAEAVHEHSGRCQEVGR